MFRAGHDSANPRSLGQYWGSSTHTASRPLFGVLVSLALAQLGLQLATAAATLLHEAAHLAAAAAAGAQGVWRPANLGGGLSLRQWAAAAVPAGRLPVAASVTVLAPTAGSPALYAAVQLCAWAASLLLAVGVTWLARSGSSPLTARAAAAACWLVCLQSTWTDVLAPLLEGTEGAAHDPWWTFHCGNFGVLVGAAQAACASPEVAELLQRMAAVSMRRGAQSAGVAGLVAGSSRGKEQSVRTVRVRVKSAKREDISLKLAGALQRHLMLQRLIPRGVSLKNMTSGVFMGHTRFATSSLPDVGETHPHRWSHKAPASFWRWDASEGRVVCSQTVASLFVTHNGDFEFFYCYGQDRTYGEMHRWLAGVLGSAPPAKCDSAAIAGLLELLRTQGLWAESLRLAYLQVMLNCFEDAAVPQAAPMDALAYGGSLGQPGDSAIGFELDSTGLMPASPTGTKQKHVQRVRDIEEAAASGNCRPPSCQQLHEIGEVISAAFGAFLEAHCRQDKSGSVHSPQPFNAAAATSAPGQQDTIGAPLSSKLWAGEEELALAAALGGVAGPHSLAVALEAALLRFLSQKGVKLWDRHPWLVWVDACGEWQPFLAAAVQAFLHNDLLEAVRIFHARAKGSFGLVATSQLDPGRVVLSALDQPMSLAVVAGEGRPLAVYSSGSHGVMTALGSVSADLQQGSPRRLHRVDLDAAAGELVLLQVGDGSCSSSSTISAESSRHNGGPSSRSSCARTPNGSTPRRPAPWPLLPAGAGASGSCRMLLYNLRQQRWVSQRQFLEAGRLVDVQESPYTCLVHQQLAAPPAAAGPGDPVGRELAAIPGALQQLSTSFSDPASFNSQTAEQFALHVLQLLRSKSQQADHVAALHSPFAAAQQPVESGQQQQQGGAIDVLITGVEVSLWAAEQFASDLKVLLPSLNVLALSANKLLAVLGNSRGAVAPTGFSFCRLTNGIEPGRTVALCVSHSGQTFPTLQATKVLAQALPGRCFALSGSYDTHMALAVGQSLEAGAPFGRRLLSTQCGWREVEAASLTLVATHCCLTELLLCCAKVASAADQQAAATAGSPRVCGSGHGDSGSDGSKRIRVHAGASCSCAHAAPSEAAHQQLVSLIPDELVELELLQQGHLRHALPLLVGQPLPPGIKALPRGGGAVNGRLVQQGRRWALHVLEAPLAWAISAAYIFATVVAGWPLVSGLASMAGASGGQLYPCRLLDACIYIWSWHLACLLLRLVQRRPLCARFGRRTVLVADVPMVHQALEAYVSKLFSLSYGIASLDVHGANPADHLVHRFTHRSCRGLLLAAGLPDGRLCSQSKIEAAAMLGLTQAKVISSVGGQPELLTVGHDPHTPAAVVDEAITLPTCRPKFLCEALLPRALQRHTTELGKRMATLAALHQEAQAVITGGRVNTAGDFAPPRISDLESSYCGSPDTSMHGNRSRPAEHVVGDTWLQPAHVLRLKLMPTVDRINPLRSATGLRARLAAGGAASSVQADTADLTIVDLLHEQAVLEQLLESRVLSCERMVAFMVLFHAMAARTAAFWPLRFDISRSQSCVRIATTAAPVSASELVQRWEEGTQALARASSRGLRRLVSVSLSRGGAGSQASLDVPDVVAAAALKLQQQHGSEGDLSVQEMV